VYSAPNRRAMARKVRSLTPAKGAKHIPFLISMSAIFIILSVYLFFIRPASHQRSTSPLGEYTIVPL
jgi:hypothetical protein